MGLKVSLVLLLLALLAVGALVSWARTRSDAAASGLRGRARTERTGWALGFAVLTAAVLVTARLEHTKQNNRGWVLLTCVVAAALLLALRPGLARRFGPVLLILLGLAGLLLARNQLGLDVPGPNACAIPCAGLGSSTIGPGYGAEELVLLLSYVFVLLGGWLVWRSPDPVLSRARLLLGRVSELPPRAQFRALLLLPVAIAAADLATTGWGSTGTPALWLVVALAVPVLVLRRWPGTAPKLAVAGLLFLGVAGLVLGLHTQQFSAPRDFGAVVVAGPAGPGPGWAVAEAAVLLAFGMWLVPQTFPSIGRLVGLAPNVELTRQVQQLTRSRAVVVDTAASDLRQLERDLHDGAQARLVALGMSLRAAERLIPMNPDAALALVAEARETSAKALTELRELVRGVHPPVLADRGLADAVRALALDCPLAVETHIDLAGRPPGPVETACYFAVAELLTNAVKHSGARSARVDVSHHDRLLRVEVTDFGLGGADPAAGSGLAGVEKRLAAFDGIMAISSPAGGPTIVVLEVPCVLSSAKTSTC
jgi:signal transduction histidine kinase